MCILPTLFTKKNKIKGRHVVLSIHELFHCENIYEFVNLMNKLLKIISGFHSFSIGKWIDLIPS